MAELRAIFVFLCLGCFLGCRLGCCQAHPSGQRDDEISARDSLHLRDEFRTQVAIPSGGERILEITYKLVSNPPDVLQPCITEETLSGYRDCDLVEVRPGCSTISSCPTDCTGKDGKKYAHGGAPWREGNHQCKCVDHGSRIYFTLPASMPGHPYPPERSCDLTGCKAPFTKTFMEEGETAEGYNGRVCTCLQGTDPMLMDDYTLFHLSCVIPVPNHILDTSSDTPSGSESVSHPAADSSESAAAVAESESGSSSSSPSAAAEADESGALLDVLGDVVDEEIDAASDDQTDDDDDEDDEEEEDDD